MVRIITLNLNGIRSAWRKGAADWLAAQDADFICVQELKAQAKDLGEDMRRIGDLAGHFHYAETPGYSGVGIYARQSVDRVVSGIGDPEFDREGRYLQVDVGPLTVVALYLPSGSSSAARQEAKFRFMARFRPAMDRLLDSGRRVVVCGDWNIAHQPIDLKNWKSNQKNSGFLPEERAWLGALFDSGWCDVYRRLYPDRGEEGYTWWSSRGQAWAKNVGWRLDYQIATKGIAAWACSASVFKDARFSDHAPLLIDYDWTI